MQNVNLLNELRLLEKVIGKNIELREEKEKEDAFYGTEISEITMFSELTLTAPLNRSAPLYSSNQALLLLLYRLTNSFAAKISFGGLD